MRTTTSLGIVRTPRIELLVLATLLVLLAAPLAPAIAAEGAMLRATELPKEALCAVCAVHEGTTDLEKVVASSEHDGTTYYFCDKGCKEAFDADPAAYAKPQFPRPAPGVTLTNLAGERVSLASYAGRPLLVDFWATWCKPCVKVMPELDKIATEFAPKGLAVVGIATDEEGASKVKPFLAKHRFGYTFLLDSKEDPAWKAFRVKVMPTLMLIDAEGQIVAQWTGKVNSDDVRGAIADLLRANADAQPD